MAPGDKGILLNGRTGQGATAAFPADAFKLLNRSYGSTLIKIGAHYVPRRSLILALSESVLFLMALMLATEHGPSLVLMDIRLPDMDGLEALRRLRLDERTASIPVLAITAQAMKGDRERFEEAGFDGYLSKPVDIDQFLATVEQHCGRRAG